MKRIMALTFAALLICAAIVPASAERRTNYEPEPEEKRYCTATLDDDFADDRVIVTMSAEASRKLLDCTPADFPEVDCVKVDDVMPYTTAEYREKAADGVFPYYNMLLCITLADPGKQNVLDAIKLLEQRNDVIAAEPDWVVYPEKDDGELMIEREMTGDVDFDGKVNARDVTGLMNFIISGTSADELPSGDVNGDGKLNSRDVTALMRDIVGGK